MPRDGRIIDIRYVCEPDAPSRRLLALLDASRWVGDRIATKLRELGLRLGGADHLEVVLRAGTTSGPIQVEPPVSHRLRALCTLDPDVIEPLSPTERDAKLAEVSFAALATHCGDDPDALAILTAGRVALDTHGRRLAVLVMENEAAGRLARVLQFLRPIHEGPLRSVRRGHGYTAVLEVVDRPTGERRCTRLFHFDSYDELDARVGSIVWNADRVTVRPRGGSEHGAELDLAVADLVPVGERGHLAAISLEPPGW